MSSAIKRQRAGFARRWWGLLILGWVPLLALRLAPEQAGLPENLAMPLFIVALTSMFVSLPLFHRYKRALIACQRALRSDGEAAAWQHLATTQRNGLLAALLPVWIAALGRVAELHAVPVALLLMASLVIAILYRLPRQLG
ncbi:MFS transporter [Pseudomonas sp. NW5]|uniref:MFS transporter n=1 Tax=Pseudomonas sp. NW5 TaxID=2934934 RepID=UPI0020215CCB|nr:MFS transporter [Pseudomonas sp. NW5]MCL7462817.1 MFS transporter [Pseudomonas sp. NW5]